MSKQLAARHHSAHAVQTVPVWCWLPWLILAVSAAWTLHIAWPVAEAVDHSPPAATVQNLVHWQDAQHDWLLVTDPDTRELVIYDANDGRPLQRLGAADGLGDIHSISAGEDRLLVISGSRPQVRVYKLPELQPVSLATR